MIILGHFTFSASKNTNIPEKNITGFGKLFIYVLLRVML